MAHNSTFMKLTRIFASICAFNYINRTETINIHINSRTVECRKELLPQDNQLQHWNDAYNSICSRIIQQENGIEM